jgi:hypothetical protein
MAPEFDPQDNLHLNLDFPIQKQNLLPTIQEGEDFQGTMDSMGLSLIAPTSVRCVGVYCAHNPILPLLCQEYREEKTKNEESFTLCLTNNPICTIHLKDAKM